MDFLEDLEWRQAVKQVTNAEGLRAAMAAGQIGAYVGTDPSGDSLHIGHLIPFITLKRFQMAGHKAVIIIGGGTGAIGDPSGKKSERQLLSSETLANNVTKITAQLTRLFGNGDMAIVNNNDWLGQLTLQDFLRDYGKLFSINVMIKKDIVASRLDSGISFTEFTYQILQGIDFHELWRRENVRLQIGGSDQWGNITAGIDLIHALEGHQAPAFGLTMPLMVNSDGTKFGKSEGNAIWLDPEQTSPYTFYQFWLNQNDRDVINYLKFFTFLSVDEVTALATSVAENPRARQAQRRLAQEVTAFVHGTAAVNEAETLSQALFSGDVAQLTADQIATVFTGVPAFEIAAEPVPLVDLLVAGGIVTSKRQAREDITQGAVTVNGVKQTDPTVVVDPSAAYAGRYVLVRRGKKKYFLGHVQ